MSEVQSERPSYNELLGRNQELQKENAELTRMLTFDTVTGLFRTEDKGRRRILEKINEVRREGGKVGLFRLDLDWLRELNREFTHEGTNLMILGEVGRILSSWAEERGGMAMRYHGDEFGILVSVESGEELKRLGEELTGFTIKTSKRDVYCSFSLGFAFETEDEVKKEMASLDKKEGPLAEAGTIFTALSRVADAREVVAKEERKKNG